MEPMETPERRLTSCRVKLSWPRSTNKIAAALRTRSNEALLRSCWGLRNLDRGIWSRSIRTLALCDRLIGALVNFSGSLLHLAIGSEDAQRRVVRVDSLCLPRRFK